jgi:DNA-binding GntR family transcriptional regulator
MDFSDISRHADLWPYQQVAHVIREAVRTGELAPGQRLPAQQRLAQEAGVSKSVIQNALALLREEGIVFSVPRLGYFVTRAGDLPAT